MASGDLDSSFGWGGIASTSFGTGTSTGFDVAAAGNRVYVAGSYTATGSTERRLALAAFDAAGRLDPGFGGGRVVTDFLTSGGGQMLVQPDGRIVVLTRAAHPGEPVGVAVARFNPDGTADTTFGGGDGLAPLPLGNDLALAPGGKLVVSGAGPEGQFTAARVNADGSPDTSFDGDGQIMLDFGGRNDSGEFGAVDVAVMHDGRIVLVGAMEAPNDEDDFTGWYGAVARLNPDGSYDTTYGGDGRVLFGGRMDNGVTAVETGPRGEVLTGIMEGETDAWPSVMHGSVTIPQGTLFEKVEYDLPKIKQIHIAEDGKVVVTGTIHFYPWDDQGPEIFIARYNPDGSIDRTFAGGKFIRPPTTHTDVTPDGDVVVIDRGPGLRVMRYRGQDPASTASVYQAEYAPQRTTNATISRGRRGYTGLGYVNFTHDTPGSLAFEVYSYHAGGHELRLRYANGSRRALTMDLSIYGAGSGGGGVVTFPPTGSWSNWREVSATVPFLGDAQFALRHLVTLQTIGPNGPIIDKLTVRRPETPPDPDLLEAEDATLTGARVGALNGGYSGRGYADFANPTGDTIEWTVNATEFAAVRLHFRYANGAASPRPLELTVNGTVDEPALSFGPTGSWSTWSTAYADVLLEPGVNTIRLTSNGWNGPNIDFVRIHRLF
jgi:uncharacterized delta-60 repeat protein